MIVHTDCRHFRSNIPCAPHKQTGVTCGSCALHDPVTTRILIVKLGAPGDVLRTTSILTAVHREFPGCHVTWLTRRNAAALLAHNTLVDRVLCMDDSHLEVLLTEHFDIVYGPDADALSASLTTLAHGRMKLGFTTSTNGVVVPTNDAAREWWLMGINDHLKRLGRRTYGEWLYRICDLAGAVAPPVMTPPPASSTWANDFLVQYAPGARRVVGFSTGASSRWKEKRWKARHYLDLAERIWAEAPDTAILLMGGADERAFNDALLEADTRFVDANTAQSIDAAAALIARCDWVLTSDSLLYHIACAVATPTVCLVGPTAPWELDCYGRNVVLHDARACIACYLATCPLPVSCMESLTASAVWRIIEDAVTTEVGGVSFEPGVRAIPAIESGTAPSVPVTGPSGLHAPQLP